jgi:hypothetical protein
MLILNIGIKSKNMKKKIIELGKKYGLNFVVTSQREAFDIIDYDVYIDDEFTGEFFGVYRHFTGKTSTGVTYTPDNILDDIENDLIKYKNKNYEKQN